MGKFIMDLIRSVLSSLLVMVILFVGTYCLITHEFPPKWSKMKAAWSQLDQLSAMASSNQTGGAGQLPAQLQQVAEGLMKGPENIERLDKEVKDLRERIQTLERLNHVNPAQH